MSVFALSIRHWLWFRCQAADSGGEWGAGSEGGQDPEAMAMSRAIFAAAEILSDVCEHEGAPRDDDEGGGRDPAADALTLSEAMRCLPLRDIETDLSRTFPDHPCYERDALGAGMVPALRRVLLAYSKRNTAVGYCQVRESPGHIWLVDLTGEYCLAIGHEFCHSETPSFHGRGGGILVPRCNLRRILRRDLHTRYGWEPRAYPTESICQRAYLN